MCRSPRSKYRLPSTATAPFTSGFVRVVIRLGATMTRFKFESIPRDFTCDTTKEMTQPLSSLRLRGPSLWCHPLGTKEMPQPLPSLRLRGPSLWCHPLGTKEMPQPLSSLHLHARLCGCAIPSVLHSSCGALLLQPGRPRLKHRLVLSEPPPLSLLCCSRLSLGRLFWLRGPAPMMMLSFMFFIHILFFAVLACGARGEARVKRVRFVRGKARVLIACAVEAVGVPK